MRVVAIIQARMNSTRLPGKVLANISGVPMLSRIIERIYSTPGIDKVVVATTISQSDDNLVEWLEDNNEVEYFRGNENDVLDRYYQCASLQGADLVVRVTADDPLKDPSIIQRAINPFFIDSTLDYCSNTIRPTYPEGLDVEVIRFSALERAWTKSCLPTEREHVTPYIWKNPNIFNIRNFEYRRDLSSWRWTVDKEVDIQFMEKVYDHYSNNPLVHFEAVIKYLEVNPNILKINSGIIRNEGYIKSLAKE